MWFVVVDNTTLKVIAHCNVKYLTDNYVYMTSLGVVKSARRNGLGTKFLLYIVQLSKQMNLKLLFDSYKSNDYLKTFYEAAGAQLLDTTSTSYLWQMPKTS